MARSAHQESTWVERLTRNAGDSALSTRVFIDRRPMWVILAVRGRRFLLVLCGLLIFALLARLDLPDLGRNGELALAVFVSAIFLWATEALPLMITSMLALVSFPALGLLSTRETYALFGNEVTFFILGVFILASPMQRSGLSTRIAVRVLERYGKTPERLVSAILGLSAAMSCVMSCHAVAAMFFPVVHSISKGLSLTRRSSFGKALYLSLAWGSTIGGTATLLGSGRAPLAVAILSENTPSNISFIDWALLAFPIMICMVLLARIILRWLFPSDIQDIAPARHALNERVVSLGKLTYREFATGMLMLTTILLWMFAGDTLGLATISLLAVVAAFVMGCATWTEVEEDVNWGIVLMYGGAIALGMGMLRTGASAWLAKGLLELTPSQEPIVLLAVVAFFSLWISETLSNAAVVALIMPPVLGIAQQLAIDPRLAALFIAIPCGYTFVLPMGTPGTALAFSGGFLRQTDTLRAGSLLKLAAWALMIVFAITVWPLFGYEVI